MILEKIARKLCGKMVSTVPINVITTSPEIRLPALYTPVSGKVNAF
jgi:hypothetical protein